MDLDNLIKSIIVDKELIRGVIERREHNVEVVSNYFRLAKDRPNDSKKFNRIANQVKECNSFWVLDVYEKQKIKDFIRTNRCTDKFCWNCMKMLQASRRERFEPYMKKYDGKMYHLTLTTPNVSEKELKATIDKQFKAFSTVTQYLKGKKGINGFDFEHWGYLGAVRSLEVTYAGDSYHPHMHVALALEGKLGEKKHVNQYSYNRFSDKIRKFSDEEILIQKVFRLLIDGKRLTKKNIDELDIGYACTLDKFSDGNYNELFKYITKGNKVDDLETEKLPFENFVTLYDALYNRRQIQGYGCFFNIENELDEILEEADLIYDRILEILREIEDPKQALELLEDLLKDTEYTLINRKRVFAKLKEAYLEDREKPKVLDIANFRQEKTLKDGDL